MKERYHRNVPGDFYVENGMCITCCAPEYAAPELMGFFSDPDGSDKRPHCYFKRQPRGRNKASHRCHKSLLLRSVTLRRFGPHNHRRIDSRGAWCNL
jgi:hypothetical protein